MRIVVNDIAAEKGGALTVLKNFYDYVKQNDNQNEWIFLLGENILEETERIKVIALPQIKKSRIKKLTFDFFTGKKFIKKLQPDVVLSLQNTAVRGLKVPQMIYIQQSIPFQKIKRFSFFKKNERKLAVYQHLIGRIIKKSAKIGDKVAVQTKWMKEAVCSQCKLPEERVIAALPPVEDLSNYNTSLPFQKNSFFYPTAPAMYKNNDLIFKACEILDKKGLQYQVEMTLPEKYSKPNVNCIGRIPYDKVIEKYSQSTLIFPSYIETIGLPMAEARKVGTIVLASDCPFSHEVLQNYDNAYFFNPFDVEKLAELMEAVILGNIDKKIISEQTQEQENSWQIVIEQLVSMKKKS